MADAIVTRKTFRFLRELAANNDRVWFSANKQRYIDEVRDPLLHFVLEVGPRLAKVSPHVVADPRPVGGSLFRIHRDTRFSRDKSPYKTAAALGFRHAGGREVEGPGLYLHLEPGAVFMGAGVWHPSPETLKKVRDAIVARPKEWRRVVDSRGLELDEGHEGDRLKRPPQGYDPDHPFIEDLKRKSFTSSTRFTEAEACAPNFPMRFVAACRQKTPLMDFLSRAAGLRW